MTPVPMLSHDVLVAQAAVAGTLAPAWNRLPERAVQFGTGAFLRGFLDALLDDANRRGAFNGRIVTISSTGSGRDAVLNAQQGLFTLVEQGMVDGTVVRRQRVVGSVSRALSARDEWDAVLGCARDANIAFIFSNTTEAGIELDLTDSAQPPRTYPAKLTRFLHERARHTEYSAAAAPVVLPCELLVHNGARLREMVIALATHWALEPRFISWVSDAVPFCNTLVDRIVTGAPTAVDRAQLERDSGYRDDMITMCEPYRLFAIAADESVRARLTFADECDGVHVVQHLTPFVERKLRLLNGTHTIMVNLALLAGCETVLDAMHNERLSRFVERALRDELVPTVDDVEAPAFAAQVLDRFRNPFLQHALRDIAFQGTMKMRVRVIPVLRAFVQRFGQVPHALTLGLAAQMELAGGSWRGAQAAVAAAVPTDSHADALHTHWQACASDEAGAADFVARVCADVSLWGEDLTALPGVVAAIAAHLVRLRHDGAAAALDAYLAAEVV